MANTEECKKCISVSKTTKSKKCCLKECGKKLSIIEREFVCRCGKKFCGLHRLPEQHNCIYDFGETKEEQDRKVESMKCVVDKISKI